jgi:riboflavin biosynthesis pyrimidine reductase
MANLTSLIRADGPQFDLPDDLRERYGGSFGVGRPRLVANFVSTIDGVVAIPSLPRSSQLIAGGDDDDRFVMALLRAVSDAIVIGSGTLHASPNSLWTPARPYPAAQASFEELRRRLKLSESPDLVVLTGSGDLDASHPALENGALVLTTDRGASKLCGRLPAACSVVSTGPGTTVDLKRAVKLLHDRGRRRILTEAGPRVFGSLVKAQLVDELFLTISPLLAGRAVAHPRLGLIDDVELLPSVRVGGRLLDLRQGSTHTFFRYALDYESDRATAEPHQARVDAAVGGDSDVAQTSRELTATVLSG